MSALVGIDWGTTSFRAYLFDRSHACVDKISAPAGIMQVGEDAFEDVLYGQLENWLTTYPRIPVIASGMITSKQGWVETPYLACPAPLADLSKHLVKKNTSQGQTFSFIPGVCQNLPVANIMRGEETQMAGFARHTRFISILPGTHSKWIQMEGQTIEQFWTFMTGELFSALTEHTILGRLVTDDEDPEAFLDGVREGFSSADDSGGILSRLFGARAKPILNKMRQESIRDYISGLLLGTEIQEALGSGLKKDVNPVICGASALATRYEIALEACGFHPELAEEDLAAKGLLRVACDANLIERG